MLFYFLVESQNESQLIKHIRDLEMLLKNKGAISLDLLFAYTLLLQKENKTGETYLLSMMGLHEEAVNCALSAKNYRLAQEKAQRAESAEKFKRLLILIVKRMIKNNEDIDQVIKFLQEIKDNFDTSLRIDDVLFFFNQDMEIASFKEELADTIDEYEEKLASIKEESKTHLELMAEVKLATCTEKAKRQEIPADSVCDECFKSIISEEFVFFPCSHNFHLVRAPLFFGQAGW